MAEFASSDDQVKLNIFAERQQEASAEFDEEDPDAWKTQLTYQKKTAQIENTLHNLKLIMENDEAMKQIVFNQLADGMEIRDPVPWKHPSKFWRDADDAQLICYVDEKYGTFSQRNYSIAVAKVVDDRSYHPIRDFFQNLPEWDGVKRVETALVDYLGAEDTPYVRAVTRKLLCAAYVRVHNPGIKFDNMIVLNGDQGIGKSTFIAKLGGEWYSDSLNLSDMNDKTAAEKLQGYWILEIGELAGMKKADLDKVKAFISRQDDKYRASFGRRVTPHPRQCVFFGTTNNENGYLRDITGNRRYWNVKVTGRGKHRAWELDDDTVRQIWAETKVIAKAGEKLYLPPELEEFARDEQRAAMERDDREGLVVEYLDMLLPEGWDEMDVYKRRDYVRDTDDPTRKEGVTKRMEVSNIEIWAECFGKPKEDMKNADSYAISAIMACLDAWVKTGNTKTIPIYGKQRIYARKE
ncbi:MAG: virulence protein E [Dorea sp.]|nr:virulence protein E [Dorea sp.]